MYECAIDVKTVCSAILRQCQSLKSILSTFYTKLGSRLCVSNSPTFYLQIRLFSVKKNIPKFNVCAFHSTSLAPCKITSISPTILLPTLPVNGTKSYYQLLAVGSTLCASKISINPLAQKLLVDEIDTWA